MYQRIKQAAAESIFVYFMYHTATPNRIKIGKAKNVETRRSQGNSLMPMGELKVYKEIGPQSPELTHYLEQSLHKIFHDRKCDDAKGREWFRISFHEADIIHRCCRNPHSEAGIDSATDIARKTIDEEINVNNAMEESLRMAGITKTAQAAAGATKEGQTKKELMKELSFPLSPSSPPSLPPLVAPPSLPIPQSYMRTYAQIRDMTRLFDPHPCRPTTVNHGPIYTNLNIAHWGTIVVATQEGKKELLVIDGLVRIRNIHHAPIPQNTNISATYIHIIEYTSPTYQQAQLIYDQINFHPRCTQEEYAKYAAEKVICELDECYSMFSDADSSRAPYISTRKFADILVDHLANTPARYRTDDLVKAFHMLNAAFAHVIAMNQSTPDQPNVFHTLLRKWNPNSKASVETVAQHQKRIEMSSPSLWIGLVPIHIWFPAFLTTVNNLLLIV